MNRIALLVWISFLCGIAASAQTNCLSSAHDLFALAETHLRALPDFSHPASPTATVDPPASAPHLAPVASAAPDVSRSVSSRTEKMSLSVETDYFDPDAFHRLEESGFFVRQDTGPPTGLAKCMDAIFRPEVIHLGHGGAAVTCTLYTAIKRKNPLCLLNPIFFNLSW